MQAKVPASAVIEIATIAIARERQAIVWLAAFIAIEKDVISNYLLKR